MSLQVSRKRDSLKSVFVACAIFVAGFPSASVLIRVVVLTRITIITRKVDLIVMIGTLVLVFNVRHFNILVFGTRDRVSSWPCFLQHSFSFRRGALSAILVNRCWYQTGHCQDDALPQMDLACRMWKVGCQWCLNGRSSDGHSEVASGTALVACANSRADLASGTVEAVLLLRLDSDAMPLLLVTSPSSRDAPSTALGSFTPGSHTSLHFLPLLMLVVLCGWSRSLLWSSTHRCRHCHCRSALSCIRCCLLGLLWSI
jgi:hypothetical protein